MSSYAAEDVAVVAVVVVVAAAVDGTCGLGRDAGFEKEELERMGRLCSKRNSVHVVVAVATGMDGQSFAVVADSVSVAYDDVAVVAAVAVEVVGEEDASIESLADSVGWEHSSDQESDDVAAVVAADKSVASDAVVVGEVADTVVDAVVVAAAGIVVAVATAVVVAVVVEEEVVRVLVAQELWRCYCYRH